MGGGGLLKPPGPMGGGVGHCHIALKVPKKRLIYSLSCGGRGLAENIRIPSYGGGV